jgi:glutamate synthase domain-containing protein 2/glutamate synthase domain-containing protein 3/NAD-dependent dihydropyrimidine dehydrogenase PreA subunit
MSQYVLDAGGLTTREINKTLKGLLQEKKYDEIIVERPSAKHFIAAGMTNSAARIVLDGSVGYYLGTMIDGPNIYVNGNAGWYPGDNMTGGNILINGSAGDGCGQGMYGGELVILGDVGSRLGQIMKSGTIVVKGSSQFMTGLYMQGGRIICLGDVGENCGESIIGGEIYVAGEISGLGKNAMMEKADERDGKSVSEVLKRYELGLFDDYEFKKVIPEQKRPFYSKEEQLKVKRTNLNYKIEIDRDLCKKCGVCVRFCPEDVLVAYDKEGKEIRKREEMNPKFIDKVVPKNQYNCVKCDACTDYCGYNAISVYYLPRDFKGTWKRDIIDKIRIKAATGKDIVKGTGPRRTFPSFDDLVVLCAQTSRPPIDSYREPCGTDVYIRGRYNKDVLLHLPIPIIINAMSFGAISKEAKIAVARGASLLGIPVNTGEGGMLPEERLNAKKLIAQYASGRFGVSAEYLNIADAIEIKIGQGAKAGMGGLLMAEKVVGDVAKIRGILEGVDAVSPARHMDIVGPEDLKMKIEQLREITEWKKPIFVKYSPGRISDDVKIAAKAGADAIVVDGKQAGTGAAPEVALEEAGLPTIASIVEADRGLREIGLRYDVKLIASGGIRTGSDIVKALALGADAVGIATGTLVAMGCTTCGLCDTGKCPRGIATQDPDLRKRLNVDDASQRIYNYLSATMREVRTLTQLVGKTHIQNLDKEDLRALTYDAAKITGTKLVGLDDYV